MGLIRKDLIALPFRNRIPSGEEESQSCLTPYYLNRISVVAATPDAFFIFSE